MSSGSSVVIVAENKEILEAEINCGVQVLPQVRGMYIFQGVGALRTGNHYMYLTDLF